METHCLSDAPPEVLVQGDVLHADEVGVDQADDQVIEDADVLDSDSDKRQVCEVRQNIGNTKPWPETAGHRSAAMAAVKGSEKPCFAVEIAGGRKRGAARCRARP